MAEFKSGDRVVKMSGAAAGKYGTVNSVREDGTLNVTFDGERLPRYCDPMRCGQVVRNAKFKVGDRVRHVDDAKDGPVGVVKGIYGDGRIKVKFPGLTKGGFDGFEEDELVMANAVRNADYDIEKFEVGKVYRAPWDRDWLAKVLSRTPSSIKVAIKSARDKTWHGADEQVTLRINPRKSEEQGAEVAKGWDWEFWADVKA